MSHPNPAADYNDLKPNEMRGKALKKKIGHKSTASKLIDDLKPRKGESSLAKLKRLTGK